MLRFMPSIVLTVALSTLVIIGAVQAAPYTPQSDAQVLERLPYAGTDSKLQQLRTLRTELSRNPNNLRLATELAWRFIRLGRSEADPRYYGYAESALQAWWAQADPPAPVLMPRATIRQNRHDFSGALRDLARLLQLQPRNAQAWLTQAVVQTVIGNYSQALTSCVPLRRLTSDLMTSACRSNVLSLSGQAQRAYAQLSGALKDNASAPAEERHWVLTTLAEIAARQGWNDVAERHFQAALTLDRSDPYLLGAYADFLLDRNRPQAVSDLLRDESRIDALLLRLALAEQRLQSPQAQRYKEELQRRFAIIRQRNPNANTHLSTSSRFALELQGEPEIALQLALANWDQQHEPRDARLVLEAALAANQPAAAERVLSWLRQTGLEDVRIAALTARIRERMQ